MFDKTNAMKRFAVSEEETCIGDPSHQYHSHDDDPLEFNSTWDQERHSLARFNANCYRRIQYNSDQREYPAQLALHLSPTFGAFMAERVLGCPSLFYSERTNSSGPRTD